MFVHFIQNGEASDAQDSQDDGIDLNEGYNDNYMCYHT